MLVLGSLGSELCASLLFKFAGNFSLWLSRMWVAAVPCNISCPLMKLVLPPQLVCGCNALFCFKPAYHAYSLLSRMWVAAVSCWISSLLMILFFAFQDVSGCQIFCCISYLLMPPLGSPVCEWLLCLATFQCLLIMPILGCSVCECLLYLAAVQHCWPYLSLTLQSVSGCIALKHFCWCCMFLALQLVRDCCA